MKRYFDLHTQRVTAQLDIKDGSPASKASVEEFKKYFKDEDTREITVSQYRRLTVQYQKPEKVVNSKPKQLNFKERTGLKAGSRCSVKGLVKWGNEWIEVNSAGTIEEIRTNSCLVTVDWVGHDGNCCISVPKRIIERIS